MFKKPIITILAGGDSKRMGTDKAQLEVSGRSILGRLADLASTMADQVLIVGRDAEAASSQATYTRVPVSLPANVTCVPDKWSGFGPLGGVATALEIAQRDSIVIACDMPNIRREALEYLCEQHEKTAADQIGTVVTWNAEVRPFFAYYRFDALAALQKLFPKKADEVVSVSRFIKDHRFKIPEMPDILSESLFDINTPEEWSRFKARAKMHKMSIF